MLSEYAPIGATCEPLEAGPVTAPAADIIGDSPGMLAAFRTVARVADSAVPVFVQGERGTGKELLARLLHENSPRRAGPFVAVDCAAIP